MNLKKRRMPLAATRAVGVKTVIMDRPPEMTIVLGPDSELTRPLLRAKTPNPTNTMMVTTMFRPVSQAKSTPPPLPPRVSASPPVIACLAQVSGPLKTRMVDLRDHAAAPPPAWTLARPPSAADLSPLPMPVGPLLAQPGKRARWTRVLRERRLVLLISAAVLLITVLVLALLGDGHGAQALAEAKVQAPEAEPTANAATGIATQAQLQPERAVSITTQTQAADDEPITEAAASAMLLSGRRAEALAMYRQLAATTDIDEGIEAMILVLEQKLDSP